MGIVIFGSHLFRVDADWNRCRTRLQTPNVASIKVFAHAGHRHRTVVTQPYICNLGSAGLLFPYPKRLQGVILT
jgi:hypothetical protein